MESEVAAGVVGGLEDLWGIEGESDARPDASAVILSRIRVGATGGRARVPSS